MQHRNNLQNELNQIGMESAQNQSSASAEVAQAAAEKEQGIDDAKIARAVASNKRRGYSRETIEKIQSLVGAEVDGYIGPETVSKIMAWQKNNGLEDDGIFGPQSLGKSGIQVEQRQQNANHQAQGTKHPAPVAENPGDIVVNTAAYAQGDPAWKNDRLGKRTIGAIGCAMTSSTMALNGITGKNRTPKEVNQYLSSHGGYLGNLLIWDKVASYYGCTTAAPSPSKKTIIDQLKAGKPSVISVKGGGHWVCVVGVKANGTFIIIDPAGGRTRTGVWNGKNIKVEGYTLGSRLQTYS